MAAFLDEKLAFPNMTTVEAAMAEASSQSPETIEAVLAADRKGREAALRAIRDASVNATNGETLMITTILSFRFAIGVLVTVHEFGHFWVARRLGVKSYASL